MKYAIKTLQNKLKQRRKAYNRIEELIKLSEDNPDKKKKYMQDLNNVLEQRLQLDTAIDILYEYDMGDDYW